MSLWLEILVIALIVLFVAILVACGFGLMGMLKRRKARNASDEEPHADA
jgi:hypothetical protein